MARPRITRAFPAMWSLAAALLPVACGPGRPAARASEADAPQAWLIPLDALPGAGAPGARRGVPSDPQGKTAEGLRLLVRARGEIEAVRRSLAVGATESAGASLTRAIRDLEEGMELAGSRLTPAAAAEFEAARRSADRWRAGVPPAGGVAETIVRQMEDESEALSRALDPR